MITAEMKRITGVFLIAGLVAAAPANGVRAEAVLHARASGPLPPVLAVSVNAIMEPQTAKPVLAEVIKHLMAAGYVVADDAPLVLDVHLEGPTPPPQKPRSRLTLEGSAGSASDDQVRAEIQIRPPDQGSRDVPEVSLQFNLFQPGKPPLWTASITDKLRIETTVTAMAVELVDKAMHAFGKTVNPTEPEETK